MTHLDVSYVHNLFNDAQRVDRSDLNLEQTRNVQSDAAIVHNHFGSGVLPNALQQKVLFDTETLTAEQAAFLAALVLDGRGLAPHAQPSDLNQGNQLEVELSGSNAVGRFSVKVAIIGLSFDNSIQMDRFYFYRNGSQVTSKHYTRILGIFLNDFSGNTYCSHPLDGRIVIRETASFQLSLDPLMVAQDVEPDLFWRDFKVSDLNVSLFSTIQTGIGSEYSVDGLSINITGRPERYLAASDVTSQVGQKFLAKTTNIQKITMLLAIERDDAQPIEDVFDWSGDLVLSVYPLQTSTLCPTDIIPDLAIDFDPASQPIAQLSFTQATLRDLGYVLSDVLQPVDFVLNNTSLGTAAGKIISGNYYAITLKRAGAAGTGKILIGTGNDRIDDSRVTLFSGSAWVDVPEEDLWFQVWTDAVKIADGQGYDSGHGIQINKTSTDSETGAIVDYQFIQQPFVTTGEGIKNIGVIQAAVSETIEEQDERTGSLVASRQQFTPAFSFLTEAALTALQTVSDPLIVGCVEDNNPKNNSLLEKVQSVPGMAKDNNFCIINPDADLLSVNLLGSKLVPNIENSRDYRIVRATLCTDGYGDINGDGIVDLSDIAAASDLIGESLLLASTQQKIVDGYLEALQVLRADVNGDGYVTSEDLDIITSFVNKTRNSFPVGDSFTHLCLELQQSIGRYDGYYSSCDGYDSIQRNDLGGTLIDLDNLSLAELEYDGYLISPLLQADPVFSTVLFPGVTYQIRPAPFWQPYCVGLNSEVRLVPASFFSAEAIDPASCSTETVLCQDRNETVPTFDPGRNDFFVPDHLYLKQGEILRPDGSHYKVDFEVGTIILQLPALSLNEVSINVFEKLVMDRGDGKLTLASYPCMKYADCSTVQAEDLLLGRIRFGVSVQAYYPSLDGYSEDGYGIIIDHILGVYMDQTTGILTLTIKDLDVDLTLLSLSTKIQILVYLKKAGWNNSVLTIDPDQVSGLIST